MTTEKYYLKADHQTEWDEVTREQFIAAEQAAGFQSKFGPNHPATGGFTGGGMRGRVEYVTEQPRPEQAGGEATDETTAVYADYDERDPITGEVFTVTKTVPAASERGVERNDKMYSKSSRQTRQHVHFCMFCGQSGTELSNKQHSTLIAQRERLLEALRGYVTDKCNCYGEVQCQNCETKALLESSTTIEQEGREG